MNGVVLAIASYKSSPEVAAMLASLAQDDTFDVFDRVIVVDSCGTGALEAAIDAHGWPVEYVNAPSNLGSAGNLHRRLQEAAKSDASWVFAINHDGVVQLDVIRELHRLGQEREEEGARVGAVFPRRRFPNRGGAVRRPASRGVDLFWWRKKKSEDDTGKTAWSSSNGALYSLAPVRQGIAPMPDLWMGWEDLIYGWQLSDAGYSQFVAADALLDDYYEYRAVGPKALNIYVSDKPAWYEYYFARNLLLGSKRLGRDVKEVTPRLALEAALIAAVRPGKVSRYWNFGRGLVDGLRGSTGQAAALR